MSEASALMAENYRLRDENRTLRQLMEEQAVRLDRMESWGVMVDGRMFPVHAVRRVVAKPDPHSLMVASREKRHLVIARALADALALDMDNIMLSVTPASPDAFGAVAVAFLALKSKP